MRWERHRRVRMTGGGRRTRKIAKRDRSIDRRLLRDANANTQIRRHTLRALPHALIC
eukprot:EW704696.1.p5 GENE.EW704696.1~~EW704696.1.p5  ORF type:complete len:57 (-),score=3.29 EW704696.1:150-320(-)